MDPESHLYRRPGSFQKRRKCCGESLEVTSIDSVGKFQGVETKVRLIYDDLWIYGCIFRETMFFNRGFTTSYP